MSSVSHTHRSLWFLFLTQVLTTLVLTTPSFAVWCSCDQPHSPGCTLPPAKLCNGGGLSSNDGNHSSLPEDPDGSSSSSSESSSSSSESSSSSSSSSSQSSSDSSEGGPTCEEIAFKIQADGDNNNLYALPDLSDAEFEASTSAPGKVLMGGPIDEDRDGVLDYYDGIPLAPGLSDLPQEEAEKLTSAPWNSKLIPLAVILDQDPGEEAFITFHYQEANPLTLGVRNAGNEYLYSGQGTTQTEAPTIRIWATNESIAMTGNPYPFTEPLDPNDEDEPRDPNGNYVVPGRNLLVSKLFGAQRTGVRYLLLQPIRGGTNLLTVTAILHRRSGSCANVVAKLSVVELRPVDGQHLAPNFRASTDQLSSYGDGKLGLTPRLAESATDEQLVGGAIIDGASIVAMHLLAPVELLQDSSFLSLRVDPRDVRVEESGIPDELSEIYSPHRCDAPVLFGGFSPTRFRGRLHVPSLPMHPEVDECLRAPCYSREASLSGQEGILYYTPPRNSVGPVGEFCPPHPSAARSIMGAREEIAPMTLRLVWRDPQADPPVRVLAERPFFLRRPPIVLIHGIRVDASTWKRGSSYWDEDNDKLASRLYYADYGPTSLKGYIENMPALGKAIERALRQYRSGGRDLGPTAPERERHIPLRSFSGIRYAATRVNLVGHSMGGQISRLYLSSLNAASGKPRVNYSVDPVFGISSQGYGTISINRPLTAAYESSGNNRYFRSNNFGAGDINRFVPIGSPFKGSPLAIASTKIFDPNGALVRGVLGYVNTDQGFNWDRYGNVLAAIASTGFSDPLFQVELRDRAVCTFNTSTGNADLVEGSPLQTLLESASYPTGNKAVPWLPIVGLAIPPAEFPVRSEWEALNEEYLAEYRSRSAAFQVLTTLSNDETPDLQQFRVYFTTITGFLFGLEDPRGVNQFSIWSSDLVVNAHSQRNAKGPTPSATWGVVDPGDPLLINGTGLNGQMGSGTGIGAWVFGTVHSDSMFDTATIFKSGQGYTPWRRMTMEQESTAVTNNVGLFFNNTYDMTPNGIFSQEGERFVIDISAAPGHSLGNR